MSTISFRHALAVLLTLACTGAAAAEAGNGLNLGVGEQAVLHLPRPAKDVVVGNPAVADVTVQNATTVVVFGRKTGGTNLSVMDRRGAPLVDMPVVVGGGGPNSVAVTIASGKDTKQLGGKVVNWACGGFTCVLMDDLPVAVSDPAPAPEAGMGTGSATPAR